MRPSFSGTVALRHLHRPNEVYGQHAGIAVKVAGSERPAEGVQMIDVDRPERATKHPLLALSDEKIAVAAAMGINPAIHENDFIFHFLDCLCAAKSGRERAVKEYFTRGRYSAELIKTMVTHVQKVYEVARWEWAPRRVLDFASGYGCTARHMRHAFPDSLIATCDVHLDAVNFNKDVLGVESYISSPVPEQLKLPPQDVIVAHSFFSHMPETTWARWLKALSDALAPRGVLIFTAHGFTLDKRDYPGMNVKGNGFGFIAQSEQVDLDRAEYGLTISYPRWVLGVLASIPELRLSRFHEALWWGTHGTQDTYVCVKDPERLPGAPWSAVNRPTTPESLTPMSPATEATNADICGLMTLMSGVEPLSSRTWVFCNGDGVVYSRDLDLRDDGTIGGYDHPNERHWREEDGAIVLMRDDGEISCVLQRQPPNARHEAVYCGEFRFPPTGQQVIHTLKRALPKIGCFLRTHFWDSAVERAYRALAESWQGPVIVSSDHTQAFDIPAHIPEIQHSLAKFETYMLPAPAGNDSPMWWNGDYVLYDIFLNTDFDYFIISEYDLYLDFDLRAVVGEMIRSGVEFASFGVGPAQRQWPWFAVQSAWDAFEDVRGAVSDAQVYGCFFKLAFISRRMAAWLYARRVQAGFALRRLGAPQWPFCESFAATEAARSGLKIADIQRFLPEPQEVSNVDAVSWSEIHQRPGKLIHPVLSGDRFVRKLMSEARRLYPQDEAAQSEWLYDRVARLPDGTDKTLLCNELAQRETVAFVAEHLQGLPAFGHPHETLRFALQQIEGGPGLALEFGVWQGTTLRIIADVLSPEHDVVGFDCFTGLPEEWRPGFPAGAFAQDQLPVVPGARLVAGLFETTLPGFLEENRGRIAFVHLDADLYSSTSTVLRLLGDRLGPGTVLVFDEFFRYPGWQQHEYRAWCEFIATWDRGYEYIAYTANHEQVAIKLR